MNFKHRRERNADLPGPMTRGPMMKPSADSTCLRFGYNSNIPHRGRLYHVQTEDSGADKGHIHTHVFYRGVIVSSAKTEYDGAVAEGATNKVAEHVQGLMKGSHRDMVRRLCRGEIDARINCCLGGHPLSPRGMPELPIAAPVVGA